LGIPTAMTVSGAGQAAPVPTRATATVAWSRVLVKKAEHGPSLPPHRSALERFLAH
jgi:hypothetical protein